MAKYIDKDALVAKIERKIDILIKNSGCIGVFGENQITVYEDVLSLINTLEVKEVDLEKEYEKYYEQERYIQTFKLAKHFFEFGLKAAQKGE